MIVTRSFNTVTTGCDPNLRISIFVCLGGLFLFCDSVINVITGCDPNPLISTIVYIAAVKILDTVQT